jgi:molybdopterin molybdotransferase
MEHFSVTNAQKCILESVKITDVETVRLEQSLSRVLAEDVRANRDLPPYDVSAASARAS